MTMGAKCSRARVHFAFSRIARGDLEEQPPHSGQHSSAVLRRDKTTPPLYNKIHSTGTIYHWQDVCVVLL